MANMSYCQFETTSKDMEDCANALAEVEDIREWYIYLNAHEQEGVRRLIRLSHLFIAELEHELPPE